MTGGLRRLAAVVLAALGLAGCAAMQPPRDRLFQQNRFVELRDLMEPTVAAEPQPRTADYVYLCFAYSKTRQYDKLFACVDRMQARIDAGDTDLYWFDFSAEPALLRAQAAIELADLPTAIAESAKAYRLTQPRGVYKLMKIYALSLSALSNALAGHRPEALRFAGELALVDTSYPDTLLASDKYLGLARVRMALHDYAGALDALQQDDSETGLLKGMADLVTGAGLAGESIFSFMELPKRFIRARARLELGQVAAARADYDQMLASPAIQQNSDLYWMLLGDRGRLAEADGDGAMAADLYRRAVDAVELQRATIHAEAGRIGFVGDKQGLYQRLVDVLLRQGRDAEAFETAERAKARALVDLLGSRDLARSPKAAPAGDLVERVQQAQQSLAVADPSVSAGQGGTRALSLESLLKDLRHQAPEVASLVAVGSLRTAQIQALLPADETLVDYFGSGPDLVAFVLTRTSLDVRRLDGTGLIQAVAALRAQLQAPDRGDPAPAAHAMYQRLFAPLADLVHTGKVLVVPQGPLHYLPFAALHDGRGYLVDRLSLRMLPAAGVLPYLGEKQPFDGRMLVLGDPDVGKPELDLAYAGKEAEAIAKLWPRSTVLLHRQATKAAVEQLAGTYSRLHFATHGLFLPADPLDSGLLLAGADGGPTLLTVGELYGMKLNADLVTLSACQTGLGAIESGDDVVGFTRGFLYAGARTIVSSLWNVDDQATQDLMVGFYAGLARMSKREALRRAQMAIEARYHHPFYWAAFELTGDGS